MPSKKAFDSNKALSKIVAGGNNQQSDGTPASSVMKDAGHPGSGDDTLVHKSYYLRQNQYTAINIYAAKNGLDRSRVVRDAIDAYLRGFMEKEELW